MTTRQLISLLFLLAAAYLGGMVNGFTRARKLYEKQIGEISQNIDDTKRHVEETLALVDQTKNRLQKQSGFRIGSRKVGGADEVYRCSAAPSQRLRRETAVPDHPYAEDWSMPGRVQAVRALLYAQRGRLAGVRGLFTDPGGLHRRAAARGIN